MKLLLDQNLSPRLAGLLGDLFPGSVHVREVGLRCADDERVWSYAVEHGFAIASKDSDYRQLSFVRGQPPKVIWVRRGNCSTGEIEDLFRHRFEKISRFGRDPAAALLALK